MAFRVLCADPCIHEKGPYVRQTMLTCLFLFILLIKLHIYVHTNADTNYLYTYIFYFDTCKSCKCIDQVLDPQLRPMPSRREITFLGTLGSDWCEWKGAIWSWGKFLKIGNYSQVSKFLSTSLVKVVRFFNVPFWRSPRTMALFHKRKLS